MSEREVSVSAEQLQEIDRDLASPDEDTRWQAAIALGTFSETAPETIWPLIEKWGSCPVEDTRVALATCVLEHVLEAHFEPFFGRVEQLIQRGDFAFADTFLECWRFGEAKSPGNSERFDRLREQALQMWRTHRRKRRLKASLAKQRYKRERRQARNRERAVFIRSQGPSTEARNGLTL